MVSARRIMFLLGHIHFLLLSSLLIAFAVQITSSAGILTDIEMREILKCFLPDPNGAFQF